MAFSDAVQAVRSAILRYLELTIETLPATGDLVADGFVPYLDADLYQELIALPRAGSQEPEAD